MCGELELDPPQDVAVAEVNGTGENVKKEENQPVVVDHVNNDDDDRVSELKPNNFIDCALGSEHYISASRPEFTKTDVNNVQSSYDSDQLDNSTYATLSGSSDVICSLSGDVSLSLSSMSTSLISQMHEEIIPSKG